jgi:hypothetical protein
METLRQQLFSSLAGTLLVVTLLLLTGRSSASAATSGNATIHNWVSVTYTSGTYSPPAVTASADVTVATLASALTITTPVGKTVSPGAFVTYSTAVTSNANGKDTYNLTQTTNVVAASVSAASGVVFNYGAANVTSIELWGGITVGAAAAGQPVLSFPGGALTGSGLVNGSKIVIGGVIYTVSSVFVGSKNTAVGAASNETYGTITLTTNLAAIVNAGTQIGEYKKLAYEFTAGTPTVTGTDGNYLSTLTATSTATDLAGATLAAATTGTTTLVQSPKLTISKNFKVVAAGTAVPATVTPASYTNPASGAKPGQVIEYLLTIVNTNTSAASVASGVTITDPVSSPYTNYVAGSTYSANGNTTLAAVADVAGVSKLVTGYTFAASIIGGNNAAATAYIVYQVLVQ